MTERTDSPESSSSPIYKQVIHVFDIKVVWETLVARRRIFFVTLIISALVSTAYLFLCSPVYRVRVQFYPTTEADVKGVRLFEVGVNNYTPDEIFSLYKDKLFLRTLQQQYLSGPGKSILGKDTDITHVRTTGQGRRRNPDMWTVQKTIEWQIRSEAENDRPWKYGSDKLVIVATKDPDNDDTLFLNVDWYDPEQASALANSLAEYTNRYLAHELTNNLATGLGDSIVNIKSNIEYKREIAKVSRENQIAILEEAAQIAESLGYTEPVEHTATNTLIQITPPEQFFLNPKILTAPPTLLREKRYFPLYQFGSVAQSGGISTQGSTSPLYFRGSRVLRAEVEFLRNRTSDDPYIPELGTLLEQLTWLEKIKIEEEGITLVRMFEPSYPPNSPLRPRPTIILSIGILLGALLGVLFSLSWAALSPLSRLHSSPLNRT